MSTITLRERPGRADAEAASHPAPSGDPAWARPALLALLGATAVLYLWGLGASGWANTYYSAAVQAATQSWKALFFGSSDAANFITVDKAPAALWVMGVSARIFGVNAWSILVPQALEGVVAVGFLYGAVKRWSGPAAGLLAGAVLATTPVAALMFRFNNPDALLVLLLTAAAYAMVRAIEGASTRWLVLAGALVGFGFLAKMLQTLLVVPGFALVYLLAAPTSLRRRMVQLVWAGVALLASAGWWVAIVQLTPASSRPYIGGSQDNSLWNLIFGYNGFGRLTGNEAGSVGGGGPGGATGGGRWGITGWDRLLNREFAAQASWLLPTAVILLGAGLWLTRRAARTDRLRASLMLWGGWLVVTAAAFSFGQGIIHPYYTVALGPALGALVGIGGVALWQHRLVFAWRAVLAATAAATVGWSYLLLYRTPAWHPELRSLILAGGVLAAMGLMVAPLGRRGLEAAVAAAAVGAVLLGPAAYSVATAAVPHSGAIPSAGPAGAGGFGPGGGGGGRFGAAVGRGGGAGGPGGGGGIGGLLNGSTPSAELAAALDAGADQFTWVAATVQANQAAGYQLATGDPVMAIGGFNGTDPTPTLEQFQAYVAAGQIHWFIGGGGGFGGGRFGGGGGGTDGTATASVATQITSWVTSNFTATTVGGVTLYDLS